MPKLFTIKQQLIAELKESIMIDIFNKRQDSVRSMLTAIVRDNYILSNAVSAGFRYKGKRYSLISEYYDNKNINVNLHPSLYTEMIKYIMATKDLETQQKKVKQIFTTKYGRCTDIQSIRDSTPPVFEYLLRYILDRPRREQDHLYLFDLNDPFRAEFEKAYQTILVDKAKEKLDITL